MSRTVKPDFSKSVFLEGLLGAIPGLLCAADEARTILYANTSIESLLGYSNEDLDGKSVDFLLPGARGRRRTFQARKKDGGVLLVEAAFLRQTTDRGEFFVVTLTDATGKKRNGITYEEIVRSSPSAVIMVDANGSIVMANPRAEALFGYAAAELVGRPVEVLMPQRVREAHAAMRADFYSRPETRPMGAGRDLFGLRRDGTEVPLEIGLAPIETHEGFFVLATIVDISVRKEAEAKLKRYQDDLERIIQDRTEELRKAHGFLDSILENIPDMIFVKEAKNLSFVRFNRAGEELLGYLRDSLVGKNDYDFFPKSEADFFTSNDRAVFEKKAVLDIPEEPIHTRLKGKRLLHTKKIPIFSAQGEPEYLLGISEDITEKKLAEENRRALEREQVARREAEKGIRLRDEFISIASHELKTPLTALKMQFQVVPRVLKDAEFPGREKFHELFQSSVRQLDRFSALVDELLDITRISAGRLVLEKREVSLSEVVSKALEQYRFELAAAGCALTLDLDDTLRGYWDPTRIEQVLVNLLTNAMKYGKGKPIEIATRTEGDRAVVEVRDHGIGISKEDQAKIFERFERAAPVSKYRGLGLGLYIARQLVLAHGGTIRVESEVGQGSTFTVELPLSVLYASNRFPRS